MKSFFFLFIPLFIYLFSCNRIKSEGKDLAYKTRKEVHEQKEEIVDKVLPHFDAYEADTKFNKLRFNDFLKVPITADVKNIYCHGDAMGIDADYQFGFNCNQETANKIIKKHLMKEDLLTEDFGFGMQEDFDWWNKKKIEKLQLYSWTDNDQYFKYFWYDRKEQKAYFFDFDM